jgi:hypothetical protein
VHGNICHAREHSFDTFASLATSAINLFATAIAREYSFNASASLAASAFEVFAAGSDVPLTVLAFFATALGKTATAIQ